jgi:hypothetical protein
MASRGRETDVYHARLRRLLIDGLDADEVQVRLPERGQIFLRGLTIWFRDTPEVPRVNTGET